ncbi:putative major facilitator superfamily transporter [Gordonia namibiensis NBRC 108229]|uniref:Putative major facilitator superfamily transporter n=1 Tax=Gordonia namibiensis NBRC 108229 TaxID=1208314 RepID=K6X082_9ACTN|nr:MFS transporter [Gordonia namibiensis]GAB99451.1 putative major facilitator superfamily transporter [Gordonia namibiensis NBRC 108229]
MDDVSIISSTRRWVILGCSLLAALTTTCVVSGVAYLIPALHTDAGLTLTAASTLAAIPTIGLTMATFLWGILLDRYGERRILLISLSISLTGATGAAVAAAADASYVLVGAALLVGGIGSGAANGASGRIVVGWFPAHQRGTAMGVRQMAQPLGIGTCALTMPVVADTQGPAVALAIPAVITAVGLVAVLIGITDPPRQATSVGTEHDPTTRRNPYRGNSFLARVHVVSMLLVVPQSMMWTFVPTWLIVAHDWSPAAAGILITVTQVTGAFGRIAAGRWSDAWLSRMRPIRIIAVAGVASMCALAVADWFDSPAAPALMAVASVISAADNGLAFTAIAEFAGPDWSGRGLAVQNTGQYLVTAATTPVLGALIAAVGFPAAFAATALASLVATPLVPPDAQRLVEEPLKA